MTPLSSVEYANLLPPPVLTRNNEGRCSCYLCTQGRDTLLVQAKKTVTDSSIFKKCTTCHGTIAPGVSHICQKSVRNENVIGMVRSLSDNSRGQVIGQVLRGKSSQ